MAAALARPPENQRRALELRRVSADCGLRWQRRHWFARSHRVVRLGGIVVELRRE